MQKIKLVLGTAIFISLIAGMSAYILRNSQNKTTVMSIVSTPPPMIAAEPEISTQSQVSPDGTQTVGLRMSKEMTEIIVNDGVIATRSAEPDTELSIPFNTWSPDNKYFFLNQKNDRVDEYLVMNKTGTVINDDSPYLPIVELFTAGYPESRIVSVTGWAAPNLLIVNAESENEAKMSFWFEVQTHKFIRLSNYFY